MGATTKRKRRNYSLWSHERHTSGDGSIMHSVGVLGMISHFSGRKIVAVI
jgi:hypothetical protein